MWKLLGKLTFFCNPSYLKSSAGPLVHFRRKICFNMAIQIHWRQVLLSAWTFLMRQVPLPAWLFLIRQVLLPAWPFLMRQVPRPAWRILMRQVLLPAWSFLMRQVLLLAWLFLMRQVLLTAWPFLMWQVLLPAWPGEDEAGPGLRLRWGGQVEGRDAEHDRIPRHSR